MSADAVDPVGHTEPIAVRRGQGWLTDGAVCALGALRAERPDLMDRFLPRVAVLDLVAAH